jgi:hypothetical protein
VSPVVTAYGGAPHGPDDDVAGLILGSTAAPFLPSEPASSMTGWLEGRPKALSAIARRVAEGAPEGSTVVATAPGPLTLATAARAAAHPAYRTHLALDALVAWSEHRLDELERIRPDVTLVVVLDESALAVFAADSPDASRYRDVATSTLAEIVGRAPVPLVICTGGDTDWSIIAEVRPARVCWNATELAFGFEEHIDALAQAVGEGMGIVWGVASVDPAPLGSDDVTLARYRAALARLVVAGAPISAIRDDAWFVPSGSMEHLRVERARQVLARVAAIAGEADD